jgi:hypothetical protein
MEFLQQDLCDIFEKIIPTCKKEGQYMHPGPKLTEFSREHGEDKPETLNNRRASALYVYGGAVKPLS